MKRSLFFIFLISILTSSCKFEYSPYDAVPSGSQQLTTETNLKRIHELTPHDSTSLKIAVIADTHYAYDELNTAITKINTSADIDFVILAGDYSDQGLEAEYEIFTNTLKSLNKPVLTVIGNHDYLAMAEVSYEHIFGPKNYVMDLGKYHFIFFDNVFWESNKTPDFGWFEKVANAGKTAGKTNILISHIPPFGEQYTTQYAKMHMNILMQQQVPLSIHGHMHQYSYTSLEGANMLVVSTIKDREYCTVQLRDSGSPIIERVTF